MVVTLYYRVIRFYLLVNFTRLCLLSQVDILVHQKEILHSLETEWLLVTLDDPDEYKWQISQLMKTINMDNVAILQLRQEFSSICIEQNMVLLYFNSIC